ncbi:MAG: hypothetical protein ACSHX6_13620 [Akkermansiaceae bacterium]
MPILFGTLTALVLAISAWIGYKNQTEYKKQIGFRQTEERKYDAEVEMLKQRTGEWQEAIDAKKELMASNEGLSEELAELEEKISAIKSEIAQKETQKKQLETEVAEATAVMDKVGGVRALVPKIKGLRSDIASLSSEIEQGNATLNNLRQTKTDTAASIAVNEKRVEFETSGKSQPTLKTTIKTVYSSWGFVTLNGGDVQGVVPGSTLSVVRGDEVVAKLKVTTVEPNRAAADILRESVGDDVYLRAGDKVVAEATAEPAKPAADKVTAN